MTRVRALGGPSVAAAPRAAEDRYSPLDERILSHYPQVRAIRSGLLPPPRMAILYPVYGCNLDCVGCEYGEDNTRGFVMLDGDRFMRLVDELGEAGVEGIEFCGGGEPSLHPQLIDAVLAGARRGIRFGMLTNGTALSDRFLEEALPHFAYIRVTLDAADGGVYATVRPSKGGRSPWLRVLDNIRRLVSERTRRGLGLDVTAKFLVGQQNAHQIDAAVDLAMSLGVDGIQFKALRLNPAELDPAGAAAAARRIAAVRQRVAPFPVLGGVDKLVMRRPCELTPLQVTIDAHGDVFLCCYFRHRREQHRFGNVYNASFREIWESPRHREAIAGIEAPACSVLDCRFVRYHEVLDRAVGAHGDGLAFL